MSTTAVPQPQAVPQQSAPVSSASAAAPSAQSFYPRPKKTSNQLYLVEWIGVKRTPWNDNKTGEQKYSITAYAIMERETDAYNEIIGRFPAALELKQEVFDEFKNMMRGVKVTGVIPLWLEGVTIPLAKGSKVVVTGVHFSPYQIEMLRKGIQPLSIDPPTTN